MSTAPRSRWYLRAFPLALLTVLAVVLAMIVTIGSYAWRRNAAFAWVEKSDGTITFGSAPDWVPEQWVASCPQWALPVDSVELTAHASGDLRPLRSLREAKTVNLREVLLTDAQLQHLSGYFRLESLSIYSSQVTDDGLIPLLRHKTLKYLELTGTSVGNRGVKHLAGHPLQILNLSSTRVTDDCMDTVGSFKQLHTLLLDGTSVSDTGMARLKGLPLRHLSLQGTGVSDAGIAALGPMPDMIWLHLDRTGVGDQTLGAVGTWPNLSTLTLSHTRITNAGLPMLTSGALRSLDFSGTAVSDAGLEELPPKPELGYLELSGTRVTADVARDFAESHNLKLTDGPNRLTLSTPPPVKMGGTGMF